MRTMMRRKLGALSFAALSMNWLALAAHGQAAPKVITPDEYAKELGAPTTLTLHLSDKSLPEIADAINAQLKLPQVVSSEYRSGKNYTLDVPPTPFWQALIGQEETLGYSLRGTTGLMLPALYWRSWTPPAGRFLTKGPFMLGLVSAQRTEHTEVRQGPRAPDAGQPARDRRLELQLQLLLDPQVARVHGDVPMTIETAEDDGGRSLLAQDRGFTTGGNMESRYVLEFRVNLDPGRAARRLKTLRGRIRLPVWLRSKAWTTPVPAEPEKAAATVQTALGPATVTASLPLDSSGAPSTLKLAYAGPVLIDDNNGVFADVRAADSDGQMVRFGGHGHGYRRSDVPNAGPVTTNLDFAFAMHGKLPSKLTITWMVPQEVAFIDIPFEFTDIPLP